MKLTFTSGEHRGESCLRAVAVINKSKKLGIAKRHQKTWSALTIRPDLTREELKTHIRREAEKWEKKITTNGAIFTRQPKLHE